MHSASPHLSIAQTKHQAPRPRPHLIDRPRLEHRLSDAVGSQRLTLMVAPAGWGKTSALTRQIAALPQDQVCAWITADADDDLQRFVACLGAALEPLDLAWRVAPSALPVLARDERGIRSVVDEVVNAMAGMQAPRGLLVLDDMHRIVDADVLALVAGLVDRLPASWGVVLASRHEPAGLPLSRWRARGELSDLRQGDLQFDEAEVAALLAARGHDAARATEWLRRTDGWVAGLHLLLSSKANARESLTSGQRHVFDFLADEVLEAMSPAMRTFLLRCSVLPELTARRCAHVSGLPNARALFDQLEREELFVAHLEGSQTTLRLHDLFRDFLADRLQRDHADELPALLLRAAEQEDDLTRAVPWLLRAGEDARAARMLAQRGPMLLAQGATATFERLIESVPKAVLAEQPEVLVLHGMCAYVMFRFEDAVERVDAALDALARLGRNDDLTTLARVYRAVCLLNVNRFDEGCHEIEAVLAEKHAGSVGGFVEYFGAWMCWARFETTGVAPHFAAAIDRLEAADNATDWEMVFFHSMFYGLPGIAQAMARMERALTRLTGERSDPQRVPGASLLRLSLMHHRAVRALGQARVSEAAEWLARGDADLRWLGQPRSLFTENQLLHMVIDAVRGDSRSSLAAGRAMLEDIEQSGGGNMLCHRESGWACEGRACWALGLPDELARAARSLREHRNPYEWRHTDAEQATLEAMVALNEGRAHEAEAKLAWQLGPIEDLLFFRATTVYLLCAEAQRRQGKLDEAARTLKPWFDHVRAGGPAGGALLVGPGVLDGLAKAPWQGRVAVEDAELLRRLHQTAVEARVSASEVPANAASAVPASSPSPAASAGLVAAMQAGLTEREAEVLAMIADGDSNKVLARKLDLSPFTVKRHVANILVKLQLESRTQAAAWWLAKQPR